MKPFAIRELSRNSVRDLYNARTELKLDPDYQRQSDAWSLAKKQLFVDSVINGFDIPKLYFHELLWTSETAIPYRYAIVDGKQRLETLWGFLDGTFTLSDEFDFLENPNLKAAEMSYTKLALEFPQLSARVDEFRLPVVVIETEDLELIEELFSRLNEAVPLNAPEKRNAFGGPLPPKIRAVAKHELFATRLPLANSRYRHLDLATKCLYIEYKDGLVDLKKRNLDDFVLLFKHDNRHDEADSLTLKSIAVLERMCDVFVHQDYLLSSVGMIAVYYQLFRDVVKGVLPSELLTRAELERFDRMREQNKAIAREVTDLAQRNKPQPEGMPKIDQTLVEFDRFMQSPNDSGALKFRYNVILRFLVEKQVPRNP